MSTTFQCNWSSARPVRQELLELILVPDVDMHGSPPVKRNVVGSEVVGQRTGFACSVDNFTGCIQVLGHMGVVDFTDVTFVLVHQMGERRGVAVAVECAVSVGDQQDQQPTGPQHTMDVDQHGQRIGKVLDDVTGYDEVLAFVLEPAEPVDVEIRDDVGWGESGGLAEFGEQRTVLTRLPAVDVADRYPIGDGEWDVARTDLDPLAAQPPREAPPNCQWIHIPSFSKATAYVGRPGSSD